MFMYKGLRFCARREYIRAASYQRSIAGTFVLLSPSIRWRGATSGKLDRSWRKEWLPCASARCPKLFSDRRNSKA
jgi:hypothetical protein